MRVTSYLFIVEGIVIISICNKINSSSYTRDFCLKSPVQHTQKRVHENHGIDFVMYSFGGFDNYCSVDVDYIW